MLGGLPTIRPPAPRRVRSAQAQEGRGGRAEADYFGSYSMDGLAIALHSMCPPTVLRAQRCRRAGVWGLVNSAGQLWQPCHACGVRGRQWGLVLEFPQTRGLVGAKNASDEAADMLS